MKEYFQQIYHVLWLFKQMLVLGFKGDWEGSAEARFFLMFHLKYNAKKIK